jgi:hypothetical protein
LTDFEGSKQRLAQIRQAEADLKAVSFQPETKLSKRGREEGRPKKPGSKRDIAEKTGISPADQVRVEKHVDLGERFPFFQRNGWVQYQVLQAERDENIERKDFTPTEALALAKLLEPLEREAAKNREVEGGKKPGEADRKGWKRFPTLMEAEQWTKSRRRSDL